MFFHMREDWERYIESYTAMHLQFGGWHPYVLHQWTLSKVATEQLKLSARRKRMAATSLLQMLVWGSGTWAKPKFLVGSEALHEEVKNIRAQAEVMTDKLQEAGFPADRSSFEVNTEVGTKQAPQAEAVVYLTVSAHAAKAATRLYVSAARVILKRKEVT